MAITANGGHTATWQAAAHPGEVLFVIVRAGDVSLAKQEWVVEQAYTDAREDPEIFGGDWDLVFIREHNRNNLDPVKWEIVEAGSTDDSGLTIWKLVVTNLVTHKVHTFGLE